MKPERQKTLRVIIASAATWQLTDLLLFNERDALYNRAVDYYVKKELRKRGHEKHIKQN